MPLKLRTRNRILTVADDVYMFEVNNRSCSGPTLQHGTFFSFSKETAGFDRWVRMSGTQASPPPPLPGGDKSSLVPSLHSLRGFKGEPNDPTAPAPQKPPGGGA